MIQLKINDGSSEFLTLAALKHQIRSDRLPNRHDVFRFINVRGLILNVSRESVNRVIRERYSPCEVTLTEDDKITYQEKGLVTILQPISPIRWQMGQSIIFKARLFQTVPASYV
ncbi:MAG: hypothetical protein IPP74_00715 [Alphaproteobacteria bacterium]|nr:hypothetical protein [Alphaproteobacteria bacterium]